MKNYEIIPITEEHIEGFRAAVDSVAREHKYLAFLCLGSGLTNRLNEEFSFF